MRLAATIDDKLRRTFVTPEGIPIDFTLAHAGDRAAAFLIDCLIMFGVLAILYALITFGGGPDGQSLALPFLLVTAFVVQSFYFVLFELRWQGSTPGKRAVGIRVIDAGGGALGAGAVLARNLVRDVEVWIPLQLIAAGEQVWPDAPVWARFVASGWALIFLLLPLFNKDRLRVGDLVGGTRVVRIPKAMLFSDVADDTAFVDHRRPVPTATFTETQLDVYGTYELQVLEGLLRGEASPSHDDAVTTVYDKITSKIGWTSPAGQRLDRERFLRDFYAALRAHLERKALLGQRKQDKFAR